MELIPTPRLHEVTGYSHVIRSGNLLFVSGQIARDPAGNVVGVGDIRVQAVQVFENLKTALESAGSSLDRVVKIGVYYLSREHRPAIFEVRDRYLTKTPPASTMVIVAGLGLPEYLLEVEAYAEVG